MTPGREEPFTSPGMEIRVKQISEMKNVSVQCDKILVDTSDMEGKLDATRTKALAVNETTRTMNPDNLKMGTQSVILIGGRSFLDFVQFFSLYGTEFSSALMGNKIMVTCSSLLAVAYYMPNAKSNNCEKSLDTYRNSVVENVSLPAMAICMSVSHVYGNNPFKESDNSPTQRDDSPNIQRDDSPNIQRDDSPNMKRDNPPVPRITCSPMKQRDQSPVTQIYHPLITQRDGSPITIGQSSHLPMTQTDKSPISMPQSDHPSIAMTQSSHSSFTQKNNSPVTQRNHVHELPSQQRYISDSSKKEISEFTEASEHEQDTLSGHGHPGKRKPRAKMDVTRIMRRWMLETTTTTNKHQKKTNKNNNRRKSVLFRIMGKSPLPKGWNLIDKINVSMMSETGRSNLHPTSVNRIPWDLFLHETNRLASFAVYPSSAYKPASDLAQAGFVYIGDARTDEVMCYFCYGRKIHWRTEDDINTVHRALNPTCPMLPQQLLHSSFNVPSTAQEQIFSNPPHDNNQLHTQELQVPDRGDINLPTPNYDLPMGTGFNHAITTQSSSIPSRYSMPQSHGSEGPARWGAHSFSNVPFRNSLASLPPISTVVAPQCPTNAFQSNSSVNSNTSSSEQATHHPSLNNQIYSFIANSLDVAPPENQSTPRASLQELGIFHESPRRPDMALISARLETFEGWPSDSATNKHELADAGLYYKGYADATKCFYCDGQLWKWLKTDNPFVEHARLYPTCSFIHQRFGNSFVDSVLAIETSRPNLPISFADIVDHQRSNGIEVIYDLEEKAMQKDPAVRSLIEHFEKSVVMRAAHTLCSKGVMLSVVDLYDEITKISVEGLGEQGAVGAAAESHPVIKDLTEKNMELRRNLLCKICMDKTIKVVFLPCGHLATCQECAVAMMVCPVCRGHIRASVLANIF